MFASPSPLVRHAVDVNATPEACWKVLTDLATWPRWFPRLQYASSLSEDGPFKVGNRFEMVFDFGISVSIKPVVEEVDAPRRVRWVGGTMGITGNHAFTLERLSARLTRFVSHEEFSGPGARLLPRKVLTRLDDEVSRSLERFKALVESR